LFGTDGTFLGYRGGSRDVTHLIRTEEQLRDRADGGRTANRTEQITSSRTRRARARWRSR
jgi:hypothetical protein